MIRDQDFDRMVRSEFREILPSLIWQNNNGDYEAFGKYRIVPMYPGYNVYINDDFKGYFNSTRTAISWCVADKYQQYNLARDLLNYDTKLANIKNDIFVRAAIANKTRDFALRENIEIKLELKILHKRNIESHLTKCLNWAKYLQQKGFENETARPGLATTIKTNRTSV